MPKPEVFMDYDGQLDIQYLQAGDGDVFDAAFEFDGRTGNITLSHIDPEQGIERFLVRVDRTEEDTISPRWYTSEIPITLGFAPHSIAIAMAVAKTRYESSKFTKIQPANIRDKDGR